MTGRTFISSVLAGMFIAFGAAVATTVSFAVDNVGIAKLISGCVFPVGLMLVVILGCDLFTGKCLLFADLMDRTISGGSLAKKLSIIYSGNLVGAFIAAGLVYLSGNLDIGNGGVGLAAAKIAYTKSNLSILNMLCSGILCNMLVCLAVLMMKKGQEPVSKIFAAFFPIMAFVSCGFEHSVANMYYLLVGLIAAIGYQSPFDIGILNLLLNLCIVTVGNIIGGAVIALGMRYINMQQE